MKRTKITKEGRTINIRFECGLNWSELKAFPLSRIEKFLSLFFGIPYQDFLALFRFVDAFALILIDFLFSKPIDHGMNSKSIWHFTLHSTDFFSYMFIRKIPELEESAKLFVLRTQNQTNFLKLLRGSKTRKAFKFESF